MIYVSKGGFSYRYRLEIPLVTLQAGGGARGGGKETRSVEIKECSLVLTSRK